MLNYITYIKSAIIVGLAMLPANCGGDWSSGKVEADTATPIERVSKRDPNIITFVTINSPNTYYINSDREFAGLEYDLAKAFLNFISNSKQIEFIVVDSIEEVVEALENDKADIAAADLTITKKRQESIDFSTPYQEVRQQVVYNKAKTKRPAKQIKDLVGKNIVVPAATSFVERLKQYKKKVPKLSWIARKASHSENILEDVAAGRVEYTIADNHLISVVKNFHPNLRVAFPFGESEKIAWGVDKKRNPILAFQADAFFKQIKKDGSLRNLIDRYHGNADRLKPMDINRFLERSYSRLTPFEGLFKEAQEVTGIDWRMLAALSYQESHWDPLSKSPTNVRGLMMLTEATSRRMGVKDRLDPKQSIPAGAKYLNLMINTIPDRVPYPDRIYMALASYNIGYAHVEDARVLAQRLGNNPDSWVDVKKALLKLNKHKYYAKAKYGYCRCAQPVIYVESVRSYYSILSRFAEPHEPLDNNPYAIAQLEAIKARDLFSRPYTLATQLG